MLVLTRKEGERILIVEAPAEVSIMRSEVQASRDESCHAAEERSADSTARHRE